MERLARLGFAAKGVVYIFVGILAAEAAVGSGGKTTGSRGALATILEQPFGRMSLAVIALGLFGYAVWRVIEAITDPTNRGTSPKGIALRLGSAGKAFAYGALGFSAVRLLQHHAKSGGDDQSSRHWSAFLLDKPFGRALLAIIGLSIIGYGIYQFVAAARSKLNKDLALGTIPATTRVWIIRVCRFGIAARGIVFVIIGYFLVRAAFYRAPSEAKGVGGALRSFYQHPYGHYSLLVVSFGLAAYGVYQLINSRYRNIRV
ncbi:MAG TPA: DUF1206 domain-containing protein [Thermoanaerobaculia bacterium]|nr:DUF1206 domain-containing protein [Thermoanaerobaculia bacterium]